MNVCGNKANWAPRMAILLAALAPAGARLAQGQAATPAPVAVPTPQPANPAPGQTNTQAPSTTPAMTVRGEATSLGTVTDLPSQPLEPPVDKAPGVVADQVVAVVNGDLILESDVREEKRFEAFEPFLDKNETGRDRTIERLIDRRLILQQAKLQDMQQTTPAEAEAQLQTLRKDLPACKAYACETDAGWAKFVHDQGFTMPQLVQLWQQRMDILKFIELRFRSGVDITPAQIQTYYEKTMLPQYAKAHATPPKLAVLSDRIQEVLLEQQVSSLLSDWLKSLKAQGTVRVMRPGEVEP